MKWTVAIATGWGMLLTLSMGQAALPASWWFDAGQVEVQSVPSGTSCPPMDFHREINRPFTAEWVVTLMRETDDGGFATYRTFPGKNDYRPGNDLPDNMDLCWWTWEDALDLEDGRYVVHTLWRLDVDGGIREIRRKSKPFTVGSRR